MKTTDEAAEKLGNEIDKLIEQHVKQNDITYDTVMGILFHRACYWSQRARTEGE
jgi:hypothetical protein